MVELGSLRLYHAGDTIDFDGLAERLRELAIEVALVPINGRSAEREAADIVGNLDSSEAVALAAAARARVAIPMHYDMFAANLGDVGAFATDLPGRLQAAFIDTMQLLRNEQLQDLLLSYPRPQRTFLVGLEVPPGPDVLEPGVVGVRHSP